VTLAQKRSLRLRRGRPLTFMVLQLYRKFPLTEWHGVEFEGRSVLDIGGYTGWAAKAALEAGAKEAVMLENGQWRDYGWSDPGVADERIKYQQGDFMTGGKPADIVICFNVIYHQKDPPAAIRRLRKLTKHHLLLRTSMVAEGEAGPDGWLWYPDGTGHENRTVFARPTRATLVRALEEAGFSNIRPGEPAEANDEVIYVADADSD